MAVRFVGANSKNFTVGRNGRQPGAISNHVMLGTFNNTINFFQDPNAVVSSNYAISLAGEVVQFVKDEDTAYANGPIRNPNLDAVPWLATAQQQKINPNSITISIEWEGTHKGGRWIKVPFQGDQIDTIEHGSITQFWVPTDVQYQAGVALIRDLCAKWNIPLDRAHITRHSDYDSVKKWFCPGEGFPMARLLVDVQPVAASRDLALAGAAPAPPALPGAVIAPPRSRYRLPPQGDEHGPIEDEQVSGERGLEAEPPPKPGHPRHPA